MKRLSLPVLPAIVIAGGVNPASALELGAIDVQSNLGQPLRASIAYALAPNEALADYCVSLAPLSQLHGLPAISRASVAVSNGVITITGKTPVSEPLLSARLEVNCPYTPKITREFMLFVDPAELPADSRYASTPAAAPARNEPGLRTRPRPGERTAAEAPVAIGSSYRVQPGDSLSEIAMRLEDRQTGLWQAVNAIFQANPDAFIDNDPNQLKAGVLLNIPSTAALGRVAPQFPEAVDAPAEGAATGPAAGQPAVAATSGSARDDTAFLAPLSPAEVATPVEPAVRELGGMTVDSSLDTAVDGDTETIIDPAADATRNAAGDSSSTRPPAEIAPVAAPRPAATSVSDRVAEPAPLPVAPESGSSNAVWWTLGGSLVLVGGLLFWRRRKDDDHEDIVAAVAARAPQPARTLEDDSIEVQIIDSPEAAAALDFDLSDDSPTEENLALDANLFKGEGLSEAEPGGRADFGFAETTDLDLQLTEAAAREPQEAETDIIPPPQQTAGSILESEVLPEEHDYDMSVIMDVTKIPQPEEATERDLKAVVVDDGGDAADDEEDGYTLSQEVDYQVLEQDYEAELTVTEALNMEIERAARKLAADLDEVTVESETLSHDETTALPVANIAAIDATTSLAAGNDDISNEDGTEEITINLDAGDKTVEMVRSNDDSGDPDDLTAEMELDPGKVDSRGG